VIRIVTIEREYGSGAGAIAQALADQLGWKLWDHAITCEIAARLKCDVESVEQREERVDPVFYRLMKAFMRGSYEASLEGDNLQCLDAEHLALLFEKVVTGIAAQGDCVIVGRGSPWFLRHRKDALHVFLYAPYDEKVRRVIAQGKSQAEAEDLVESVDRARVVFIKKYYGKDWPDRYLYNLMLNSQVGDEVVVRTILNEIELLNGSPDATKL
jgi:cytidylate kinase